MNDLAAKEGRVYDWVRRRLCRQGVLLRSSAEGVHLAKRAPPVEETRALRELVDGLLLGDGSIECGRYGARLRLGQCADHRDWVKQVQQLFEGAGVICGVRDALPETPARIWGKVYRRQGTCKLTTRSYAFLKDQRERWYPHGSKRVPKDVLLTPLSLAHWYAGDGTVGCKGYHAKFCTDGFPEQDVLFLIRRLHEVFGWSPVHEERNRILLCRFEDRQSLVSMLQDLMPGCFRSKLRLRTQRVAMVVLGDVECRLRELRSVGIGFGVIAQELGLSKSGVYSACQRLGL